MSAVWFTLGAVAIIFGLILLYTHSKIKQVESELEAKSATKAAEMKANEAKIFAKPSRTKSELVSSLRKRKR